LKEVLPRLLDDLGVKKLGGKQGSVEIMSVTLLVAIVVQVDAATDCEATTSTEKVVPTLVTGLISYRKTHATSEDLQRRRPENHLRDIDSIGVHYPLSRLHYDASAVAYAHVNRACSQLRDEYKKDGDYTRRI